MVTSTSTRKAHFGSEERRNDVRIPCEGATVVDVLSPQPRTAVQARILDVGRSSLKLSIPLYLSPGTLIRIYMTDSIANAEVRYCTCEGAQYHAGVQVEEIAPKGA